jgi:hypothetical protein
MNHLWLNITYPQYLIEKTANEIKSKKQLESSKNHCDFKYCGASNFLLHGARANYLHHVFKDLEHLDKTYQSVYNVLHPISDKTPAKSIYETIMQHNYQILDMIDNEGYDPIVAGDAALLFTLREMGQFHTFLENRYGIPALLSDNDYYALSYAIILIDHNKDAYLIDLLKNYLSSLRPTDHPVYNILEKIDSRYHPADH